MGKNRNYNNNEGFDKDMEAPVEDAVVSEPVAEAAPVKPEPAPVKEEKKVEVAPAKKEVIAPKKRTVTL